MILEDNNENFVVRFLRITQLDMQFADYMQKVH